MVRSGREPAAVEVNVAGNQQSNGTRPQRRRYTAEQRKAVVADALQIGVLAAAEQHGVPQSCVSRWSSQARNAEGEGHRRQVPGAPRGAAVRSAEPAGVAAPSRRGEQTRTVGGEVGLAEVRRVARTYSPSQRALVLEYAAREGVTAASEKYGPSRYTIYDWQRKVAKATTRRVMEEAGYRPPKVKREPHDERYESVRPNHCWHLDFVHRHINRASTFTLILIDDYSRFVVGHGVEEAERADLVLSTFEEAVRRHGRPEMVLHDKGSAFWSWRGVSRFTALLTELGVDQIAAEHKEWNGKLEVFNANLAKEFFDQQRFYDVAEMRRRLAAHLSWYNEARTHHALGGLLVPADRYYGRVEQVLARIEAGAGRDPADGVELRDRCLELFKVTSRAGVPEVWLLGQKLLGAAVPRGVAVPGARPGGGS
jgi:transposase InsO family protein